LPSHPAPIVLDRGLLGAVAGMVTRSSARSLYVTVISDNPETIDGLHGYLSRAGVASRAIRALRDASTIPPSAIAVVIFPDEFGRNDVVASINALRAARPRLLILIVTSAPQHFRSVLKPDGRSLPPIALPKPTFGWTILDAIRAHANSELP